MPSKGQRKVVVLFSHNTHSFILSEIGYAAEVFEQVIVVCPYSREIEMEATLFNNVQYIPIKKSKLFANILKGIMLVNRILLEEISKAKSKHIHSRHYFKLLAVYLSYTAILNDVISNLLKKYDSREIVVASMWFSATAFATSMIKKDLPSVLAISLVHSFEVDDSRNDYVDFLFKKECHKQLDHIYFISRIVKEAYVNNHAKKNGWETDKISVSYLGVNKKREGISTRSSSMPYRIVSCSECLQVKRIDLIGLALKHITRKEIEWVHIGDGPTLKLVKDLENIPNNITIITMGKQTNDFVHEYLKNTEIDAFINVSSSEGLPVTLMEAISYGIPIIATNVGGTSEIYKKNVGLLLEANPSVLQLALTLDSFLSMNQSEIIEIRKNAYDCYLEYFNASILRPDFYRRLATASYEGD